MPDYLTPGYRNSDEGRPVWKRPAYLIIAVVVVLAVVGAAYFFNGEETDGSGGSGSDGGHTADERTTVSRIESLSNCASAGASSISRMTTETRRGRIDIEARSSTWTPPTRGLKLSAGDGRATSGRCVDPGNRSADSFRRLLWRRNHDADRLGRLFRIR
jgi:hypothetical protein